MQTPMERAKKIKLVILDVDGVLSDGKIIFGLNGEMAKSFNCRDGLGISLLQRTGIRTAIITGRKSEIVRLRAAELKITDVYQGMMHKTAAYEEIKMKYNLDDTEIAYIGDDLIDLPVMTKVGLACAVGDALSEVKTYAHYVAQANGGNGAVREICEFILKTQGKWEALIDSYVNGTQPVNNTAQ